MKEVEHLTLGGNSVIRYTKDIYPETIEFFRPFQIKDGSKFIPLSRSNFQVKVTARTEGAMFDMNKGESLAFANICCFEHEYSVSMLAKVDEMQRILKPGIKVVKPKLDQWIYSVAVDMAELNQDDITLAGEVEFYIYHAIWLARKS